MNIMPYWFKFLTELGGAYFDKNTAQGVKNTLNNQTTQTQSQYAGAQGTDQTRSNEQYNTANQRGTDVWNGYSGLAASGGISADDRNRLLGLYQDPSQVPNNSTVGSSSGGGGTPGGGNVSGGNPGMIGSSNPPAPSANPASSYRQFQDVEPVSKDLVATGGVDYGKLTANNKAFGDLANSQDLSSLDNEINTYRGLEMNGGLDQASMDRFRGGGVYDTLAKTGGYDDAAKNEFLQRATSTVPAMYKGMADEIQRRRAVQGGYAPGFSASQGLLARQASQDMNSSVRNANLDLNTAINQNKLAGAQGMTSSENTLQGLRTGNILAGASGAAGTLFGRQSAKLAALQAQTDSEQKAEQLQQQGRIAGGGFLTAQGQALTSQDVAERQLQGSLAMAGGSNALANAQIKAQEMAQEGENQRFLIGSQQQGMMGGLKGMEDLYNSNVGQGTNYQGQLQGGIAGQAGSVQGMQGGVLNAGNQLGVGGFLNNTVSPILGMAGGLFTGASGLPGLNNLMPKPLIYGPGN